ncbi:MULTISPECIES: DNA replication/repair protein RecF [Rhodomicrobium]|uniref:DNA replication/repair protein RecF n=1 Tax=Rhodomicrobium TaxID=1068 RepID=UPI001FDA6D39|nr:MULTISPECIES: DNA replication/repair protein RecF [Rhodomicrobium]
MNTHGLCAIDGDLAARNVWLARIALSNYRNYTQVALPLDQRPVVLTGHNGSGKTNILEAVSLLTPGRGLRGAPFAELARMKGDGGWAVSARASIDGNEIAIGTGQQPLSSGAVSNRVVKIDGEDAGGSGALAEYLQVVWLIPAMDGLYTGPASDRRRFLDRMVASFDGAHRGRLNHFERAMRQRNRLLDMGERSARLFDAVESQMAETGTAIAAGRIEAVDRLASAASRPGSAETGAFPHALLALEGTLEAGLQHKPAVDVEDDFLRELAVTRDRDRAAGRTLSGPHRSDLLVRHGPKDMPAGLCSTGEQKALLIGLILAHAKAVKDARGGLAPLLLLDEIAAHLDEPRREALFVEIERLGAQAWLTGTDKDVFGPLQHKAQFFTVADGSLSRQGHDDGRIDARQIRVS